MLAAFNEASLVFRFHFIFRFWFLSFKCKLWPILDTDISPLNLKLRLRTKCFDILISHPSHFFKLFHQIFTHVRLSLSHFLHIGSNALYSRNRPDVISVLPECYELRRPNKVSLILKQKNNERTEFQKLNWSAFSILSHVRYVLHWK